MLLYVPRQQADSLLLQSLTCGFWALEAAVPSQSSAAKT